MAKKDRGQVKRGPTQNNQNTSTKDSRLKGRSGPEKNKKKFEQATSSRHP